MRKKRLFPCSISDLPVLAEFLLESLGRDINDFSGYSPLFTTSCSDGIRAKIITCREVTRSWTFIKELKSVTETLYSDIHALRVTINPVEGYVKLAAASLDVAVGDVGLKEVRRSIGKGNAETLVPAVAELLSTLRRNITALQAVGLQESLLVAIEEQTATIDTLNVKQNELESERNRVTEQDTDVFNDLWLALQPILETGKALYRGVDEAKLKDYTIAQLEKRLHPHPHKQPSGKGLKSDAAGA
ncbi:MAG: hypothetical protein LBB90_00835 [Tannerella sp.]|jgi:hypothetical protein|nr:hypothetical protein [Tannerella sp.]